MSSEETSVTGETALENFVSMVYFAGVVYTTIGYENVSVSLSTIPQVR